MASPAARGEPHGQLSRAPRAGLGRANGGLDGLEHPPVVERVGDPGQPLLAQRGRALVERLLERLGHRPGLLVEDDRPGGRHDRSQLAEAVVLAGHLCHRGAVLPVGQADGGEELVGHGQQCIGGHRGLSGRLGGRVLGVDGLAHRLQTAAQELFGHGDLLGSQRRQHGVAVDGGGRHHGTLAACRATVAVTRTPTAGPARAAPATWPVRTLSSLGALAAVGTLTPVLTRTAGTVGTPAAPAAAVPAIAIVVVTAPLPRSGGEDHRNVRCPLGGALDLDPTLGLLRRTSGLGRGERQDLDALETRPRRRRAARNRPSRLRAPARRRRCPWAGARPRRARSRIRRPSWLVSSMSIRRDMRRTR